MRILLAATLLVAGTVLVACGSTETAQPTSIQPVAVQPTPALQSATTTRPASDATTNGGGDPEAGHALFMEKCSGCHADHGRQKGVGPALIGVTAETVRKTVPNGRNVMPAFKDLTPEQIDDLAAYIESLK